MQRKILIAATFTLLLSALTVLYLQNNTNQDQELDMTCGFTDDFAAFIKNNGYSTWNFERSDLKCGAFGGKSSSSDKIVKTPIIFVHGNSDIGFGRGSTDGYTSWQTGFRSLATYLGSQGYRKSQLYTTTWGPADPNKASQNNHAKKYVMQMRAFVQAVLAYTGASQVNIIGHSMGVTIGRKIAQGGSAIDQHQGTYSVGQSLKGKIKNFIGLAGANLGLTACYNGGLIPTCSNIDGFNPGQFATSGPSKFMASLNANPAAQASKVYTIWSKYDDLIQLQCVVWGKVTCRIPGQSQQVVKNSSEWTHFAVRDNTGPDLIKWLNQ